MVKIRSIFCSIIFLAPFTLLTTTSVDAVEGPSTSPEQEQKLIAVLRSKAPAAEKAMACKNLAIYGSVKAVPELAKLLPDAQLSSWARIPLEVIPGKAADDALLNATNTLQGRLLVGTLNSIGVRRDAGAVTKLSTFLHDSDEEVASAAAVALGKIGDDAATKSLLAALKVAPRNVRSSVAEGCVLCAERLYNQDESTAAVEIYDEVRSADVPVQRIVEATRGAILARGESGVTLLLETVRSPERKLQQLALATIREFPGDQVDKALADELVQATPERAAWLIQAMADRPDSVVLSALVKAAGQGDKQVRMSAINSLQRVGDESCLATLLSIANEDDRDLKQAAQETLAVLPGDNVDSQIVAMLPQAKGEGYPRLLQLIAQRRIDAVPEVVMALENPDPAVRSAALVALGQTVSLDKLSLLVSAVINPKHAEDAEVAEQALRAASVRMPDREACAAELASSLASASTATTTTLLEILSEVGGETALKTLHAAAISSDPQQQDDASRLLGKWNSVDAAPSLLYLAANAPADKYKVRALRGYIGLARKFPMPETERAAMCRKALDVSSRADEQQLVLEVLKIHPSTDGLNVALRVKQMPGMEEEAAQASLVILQNLSGKGVDVTPLLAGEGLKPVKLEIVHAEYGAGSEQKDVTKILLKYAGDLPWINLPSKSFNSSFGGDPVPGQRKRLKIEYRIDGKPGEASFAENTLILLPIPQ